MPLRSIEIDPAFLYRKNPNTVGLDGCEVLLCDPCAREMCPVCDTYVSRGSAPPVSFYTGTVPVCVIRVPVCARVSRVCPGSPRGVFLPYSYRTVFTPDIYSRAARAPSLLARSRLLEINFPKSPLHALCATSWLLYLYMNSHRRRRGDAVRSL